MPVSEIVLVFWPFAQPVFYKSDMTIGKVVPVLYLN
jgi:hypothetical protein